MVDLGRVEHVKQGVVERVVAGQRQIALLFAQPGRGDFMVGAEEHGAYRRQATRTGDIDLQLVEDHTHRFAGPGQVKLEVQSIGRLTHLRVVVLPHL